MPEQVPVKVVRTGGVDYLTVPTRDEALIAALEREREGYVQRGLADRVAAVDAELARLRPAEAQPAGLDGRRRGAKEKAQTSDKPSAP